LLNPNKYSVDPFNIIIQRSDDQSFSTFSQTVIGSNKFSTSADFDQLESDKRYWLRYKIDDANSNFSKIKSFYNSGSHPFLLADSISFSSQQISKLKYDSSYLKISNDSVSISVLSAGWYSGATCVISKNGINQLTNSFFAGMGIVVFDPITMEVDTSTWYTLFGQPANVQALADLINSIPDGKLVVIGAADDARNNLTTDLKNAIKTLGSTKIDSLVFRGSWAIIGRKGATPGEVLEEVRGPYEGAIYIDSLFRLENQNGFLLTKKIGPSSSWKTLRVGDIKPSDSEITYKIFGEQSNGIIDTLAISIVDSVTNLNSINANLYPYIKLLAEFKNSSERISPSISKISLDYESVPELGVNYQTVFIDKDSILQFDTLGLNMNLSVYNVGSAADSFNIKVELVRTNFTKRNIFEKFITRLDSLAYDSLSFNFIPILEDGTGNLTVEISIDPENKIVEKYKDNNFYSLPLVVIPDTSVTVVTESTVNVTYDGIEILDGDYIASNPNINVFLYYPDWFRIQDTSAVEFYLNQARVYHSQLNTQYDTSNKRIIFKYSPNLPDGEYTFRVYGKNIIGNIQDSPGYQRYFMVASEAQLLNVYNYPNPFKENTYFNFRLTQIPDELKIKIYTISGRLIKQFELRGTEIGGNINSVNVFWDGRDEDGDEIANGVYIYKVIMKAGNKVQQLTQKLAVVR
jgi:hypothetical protein